jgi:hypothetical protein
MVPLGRSPGRSPKWCAGRIATGRSSAASGGGPYVIVTKDPVYRSQCESTTLYSSATYDADVEQISKALGFEKPDVLWTH